MNQRKSVKKKALRLFACKDPLVGWLLVGEKFVELRGRGCKDPALSLHRKSSEKALKLCVDCRPVELGIKRPVWFGLVWLVGWLVGWLINRSSYAVRSNPQTMSNTFAA
jgi:hypothetical protein